MLAPVIYRVVEEYIIDEPLFERFIIGTTAALKHVEG
jgi:hypothetical protein